MTADRARRRTVVCASCHGPGAHRGHGWCVACYSRWVYHGRPAAGPPARFALDGAGYEIDLPVSDAGELRAVLAPYVAAARRAGQDPGVTRTTRRRECPTCKVATDRRYRARRFAALHAGHDTTTTADGRPCCRSCRWDRGGLDEVAVDRAAGGEAPPGLTPAEREAAVLALRRHGLTYELIGERVGCHLRTAWAICQRNGLTAKQPPRLSRWRHEDARDALAAGRDAAEVGRRFGVTAGQVRRIARRAS